MSIGILEESNNNWLPFILSLIFSMRLFMNGFFFPHISIPGHF